MYQFIVITNAYLYILYSVQAPCFLRKTYSVHGEDLGIILCCQVRKELPIHLRFPLQVVIIALWYSLK